MQNDIFIPTQSKFEEIIERKTASVLETLIPQLIRQANRKPYLTTSDFEELTGMTAPTQKYHRDAGNLPYIQEGRRILYETSEVEKFLQDRKVNRC